MDGWSYEDYLEEEYKRKDLRDRSIHPVSYPVRCHIRRCHWTFPNRRYPVLFHRLERIRKQKLSLSERDQIKAACRELIDSKEYIETAEELRQQLKSEAEREKYDISALKKVSSSADKLVQHLRYLEMAAPLIRRPTMDEFRSEFYELFDKEWPRVPIVKVLRGIVKASKIVIERHKPPKRRGPLPDAALRKCISELAQVFGEDAATAGWSEKEGRRVSPFIDFVQEIFSALPENAMIGRNGRYTAAAIETHVAEVCKELKKALPARKKKPKLAD